MYPGGVFVMASRPETSFPATYTCWIFRSSPVAKEKQYTAVSKKVVLQTEKSLRDNVESYFG